MARKQVLNRAIESPKAAPVPATEPMADGLIEVEAVRWLNEDGVTYPPGSKFRTTPERAESLGHGGNIKILS